MSLPEDMSSQALAQALAQVLIVIHLQQLVVMQQFQVTFGVPMINPLSRLIQSYKAIHVSYLMGSALRLPPGLPRSMTKIMLPLVNGQWSAAHVA